MQDSYLRKNKPYILVPFFLLTDSQTFPRPPFLAVSGCTAGATAHRLKIPLLSKKLSRGQGYELIPHCCITLGHRTEHGTRIIIGQIIGLFFCCSLTLQWWSISSIGRGDKLRAHVQIARPCICTCTRTHTYTVSKASQLYWCFGIFSSEHPLLLLAKRSKMQPAYPPRLGACSISYVIRPSALCWGHCWSLEDWSCMR